VNRAIVLGAVTVASAVAVGAAAGGWAIGYGPFGHRSRTEGTGGTVPVATATVTRGTITVSEVDPGMVSYAGSFTVYGAGTGTVTWLPAAGAVIRPGARLFAVDGQDVVLMRGPTPAWRGFGPGMSDGSDVAELQRNLVALGYDPYHAITPGDHYDWATQAAIERWQEAAGRTPWTLDGVITLGQVAFLPGPVRVAALATGAGAAVASGTPVLTATSTTAVVTVALPPAEQSAVTAGQRVTITLPDGGATTGRVLGAAPVSSGAPGSSGTPGGSGGGSGGSGAGGGGGSSGAGGASGGQATASILVSLDHQAAASGLAGSPVQVAIATQVQRDALVTPISALLAGPGGGFQVTVVTGGTRRDVPVRTGLFDDIDGTVAISGPGIVPGTRVEVPKS
jgi:uncharacterized membrane protein YgcG